MYDWKKEIIIISGEPGSGKTTLGLQLVNGDRDRLVENDDYWLTPPEKEAISYLGLRADICDGTCDPWKKNREPLSYSYETRLTHLAAFWCWAEVFRRIRRYDRVAVANTFVKREHIFPYIEEARKLQIRVTLKTPTTPWVNDVFECTKKNTHGVPGEVVARMAMQREKITQEEVDILLGFSLS